jgi:anti-anti-sigma factor
MTSSSAFEIHEGRRSGWARLAVTGELDIATALTFRRRLRALKAAKTHVCVDLSQLEFIDAAGAHALDDAITESRHSSWRLEVAPDMSPQARRFLDLIQTAGICTDL